MNAHAKISDQHSIEWEFEELSPTIGGVRLDAMFGGTAVLAADSGYHFYVQSIWLGGSMKDVQAKPSLFGGLPWKRTKVELKRPEASDHSPEAVLFRLLESAIENDDRALDAWRRETEAA